MLIQICYSKNVKILKGVMSMDNVHMHLEYSSLFIISDLGKRLKRRTSCILQIEFLEIGKRYWEKHFWAIGFGVWKNRNITDEMIQKYLK